MQASDHVLSHGETVCLNTVNSEVKTAFTVAGYDNYIAALFPCTALAEDKEKCAYYRGDKYVRVYRQTDKSR